MPKKESKIDKRYPTRIFVTRDCDDEEQGALLAWDRPEDVAEPGNDVEVAVYERIGVFHAVAPVTLKEVR